MIKSIILIGIGCVIGVFFCNWSFFKLKEEIEIADLFTLGITSLIGLHIAQKISQRQSNSRYEKDLLITELQEFKHGLNTIKTKNDIGAIPFEEMKIIFRDLNYEVNHLEELSNFSKFCQGVNFSKIRGTFNRIRRIITGISPLSGIIHISPRSKKDVDKQLHNLKKEIYRLILQINSIQ